MIISSMPALTLMLLSAWTGNHLSFNSTFPAAQRLTRSATTWPAWSASGIKSLLFPLISAFLFL
ncbi:exported hypothetical protein [Mesorhizobium sp. STM 4661]|nr:exported hypothetical protein [Mesorhizobium sp. STM 4661]